MEITNIILLILFTIITVLIYINNKMHGTEEKSISSTLFYNGILLIVSCIPDKFDTIMNFITGLLKIEPSETEGSYYFRGTLGLILVFMSFFCHFIIKKQIYVFNMYGIATQMDIDNKENARDLKISELKIKEQIIDFVDFFDNSKSMKAQMNKAIYEYIENSTKKFSNKIKDQKSACFTGMAPIPYTILAGTFLAGVNKCRYFEYNSHSQKYYELKKANKKEEWQKLSISFPVGIKSDAKKVVLAISVSSKINDSDLAQFNEDVVHITLQNPADNVIQFRQQLEEYTSVICKCIIKEIKEKYPNLETMYIAAAIPNCMSIEIGKIIEIKSNRLCDIVVYHYIYNSEPRYAFGVCVNGSDKGKLYH